MNEIAFYLLLTVNKFILKYILINKQKVQEVFLSLEFARRYWITIMWQKIITAVFFISFQRNLVCQSKMCRWNQDCDFNNIVHFIASSGGLFDCLKSMTRGAFLLYGCSFSGFVDEIMFGFTLGIKSTTDFQNSVDLCFV